MGKVGRVALRPLYDLVMTGGGRLDKRTRWALDWRIRLLPAMAPRVVKPISCVVDVRIYSDACTTEGGMTAIALFSRPSGFRICCLEVRRKQVKFSVWTCSQGYQQ